MGREVYGFYLGWKIWPVGAAKVGFESAELTSKGFLTKVGKLLVSRLKKGCSTIM